MDNSRQSAAEVEGAQPAEKGRGCFYTINTLMILFLLIPVLILLIFFILWLIPD
jgi:hypothetical protein